mmetsp:Transcript_41683/g.100379  ORF Transcript_41683/g.100379 Transcript_41683/m.100379 type:complete len:584 (+) Transcript_41683:2656-4407(+)
MHSTWGIPRNSEDAVLQFPVANGELTRRNLYISHNETMSTVPNSYQEDTSQCLPSHFLGGANGVNQKTKPSDEVDELLVQGLNRLTFDELQKEQDDLHGVADDTAERAERMTRLLGCLDDHLKEVKAGTAYESAERINKDYVSERDFRLRFLRANRYDPQASADQMIRFFDTKLNLFGKDKLVKDICLSDLDEDDVECLLNGSTFLSDYKDRAGRCIIFHLPALRGYKSAENELRARYYLYMHVCQSLNSPNCGIVVIVYHVGHFKGTLKGANTKQITLLLLGMPWRIVGSHMCFEHAPSAMLAKAAALVAPSKMRAKMRVHRGTHMELQYILGSYGIPRRSVQQLFLNQDFIFDHQLSWYHDCIEKETASQQFRINHLAPNENDVLYLGRKVNGAGNERLLSLAAQHVDWYFNGNSKERRTLIDLIIDEVRKKNGRFLKPDSTGAFLEEVPVEEVRIKIAQLFRNLKKKRSRVSSQKVSVASHSESAETVQLVENVRDDDVLFGRMYEHAGNKRLREVVESMSVEYDSSTRGRKKEIADAIVADVKRRGRFLKPTEDGKWAEVSDSVAEMKVSNHFRNARRR